MNKFYFSKNKATGNFYTGTNNKIGFKTLGGLKASLKLKDKDIEKYDLYYIDSNLNIYKFINWERIK